MISKLFPHFSFFATIPQITKHCLGWIPTEGNPPTLTIQPSHFRRYNITSPLSQLWCRTIIISGKPLSSKIIGCRNPQEMNYFKREREATNSQAVFLKKYFRNPMLTTRVWVGERAGSKVCSGQR